MLNVPRYPPFVVNVIVKLPELTSLNSTLDTYVKVTDYCRWTVCHADHVPLDCRPLVYITPVVRMAICAHVLLVGEITSRPIVVFATGAFAVLFTIVYMPVFVALLQSLIVAPRNGDTDYYDKSIYPSWPVMPGNW